MLNALLFLLSMKINIENKYTLFFIKVFPDVVEGVGWKHFLGASPQTPVFTSINYLHIIAHNL